MCGLQEKLKLGNLDSKRDWGYAPEYCEGMWRILQADAPGDFVLATNETHTVKEFVEAAFAVLGETLTWQGNGVDEKGFIGSGSNSRCVVEIDPRYFRPTEVDLLIGDYSKAKEILGWQPKTTFHDLVKIMTLADYDKIQNNSPHKNQ
jgi:GDPmannose 4,6-dehydratase